MDVIYAHWAGLDVHKKTVVACTRTPGEQHTHSFGTMTEEYPC
jgi:hypothetical protein